ncbi:uncharacterized protein B0I36DRAFT_366699 [Microdochium trichocladiopsis]|uniref:Apple domain-containing protein n=1 Tax=Microdochium trichocladiopsis TaxID=1682393 RepID=A0A9P8XYA3_9PEZI|nr:uncharacterized protein B0I36DRAFT_366699 [Microdochium trichocladiopsis]KAH7024785.1 hypothetical protein B0I36DRAFT_366699 [Microdochium trichocladiopsis]
MVQVHTHIAALMSLVALALADQAPVNCGRWSDPTGLSDNTLYRSGASAFTIQCHEFQEAITDWRYQRNPGSVDACIALCAASSTCLTALSTYDGYDCWLSNTGTQGIRNLANPNFSYVSAYKTTPALNCKDKSSNGAIFTPPGSSTKYQIMCDYQFGGNTLGASKRAETFEQCVGFCDTTTGCVDVVYSDAKYCWLKSSKTNGYVSPGWFTALKVTDGTASSGSGSTNTGSSGSSGIGAINCFDNSADKTVFRTPTDTYDIRCNFQYDGDTLGSSKRAETFEQCLGFCDTTAGCVDVVWSNAKYCWLKSSKKGNGYNSGGWFSAIRRTVQVN